MRLIFALTLAGCSTPSGEAQTVEPGSVAMVQQEAPSEAKAEAAATASDTASAKKVLIQCTAGSNDPTRAVLAFVDAFGAAEAGHDVTFVLAGDGAELLDDAKAEATKDVALGSVSVWFPRLRKHEIPIFV